MADKNTLPQDVDYITSVTGAYYTQSGIIECMIQFQGETDSNGQPVYTPYTASADDPTDSGRQLFADLKSGKYGQVTPWQVTDDILATARKNKTDEINRWRDEQERGRTVFVLDGRNWDCSKSSQERLDPVVAVASAGKLPANFFWTDADNNDVPMDAEKLLQLKQGMLLAMVSQGFKIHERQRKMKEEIDAMTDLNQITNFIPGWQNE